MYRVTSGSEATEANSSSASSSRGARRVTRSPVSTFTSAMPTSCTFVINPVKVVDWQQYDHQVQPHHRRREGQEAVGDLADRAVRPARTRSRSLIS